MTGHETDHETDHEDEGRGIILAGVQECPECGAAVLAGLGEDVTGCADHRGS